MEKVLRIGQAWVYDSVRHCLLYHCYYLGEVGQSRKVTTKVQRPSNSLGRFRAEPQATWFHINSYPLFYPPQYHLPRAYSGCHLGSHGLLLRLSLDIYLSVFVPYSTTLAF